MEGDLRSKVHEAFYRHWADELAPEGDVKIRLPVSAKRYLEDRAKRQLEPLSVTVRRILLDWIIDQEAPKWAELEALNPEQEGERVPGNDIAAYLRRFLSEHANWQVSGCNE